MYKIIWKITDVYSTDVLEASAASSAAHSSLVSISFT